MLFVLEGEHEERPVPACGHGCLASGRAELDLPSSPPSNPAMRLHYHPLSSYSRKTAIGIALRGDPIDLCEVNALAGDLKTPAYLAMNPFGKMPVLETDTGPVFESTSILEYLEEVGPRRLIPVGHERRARHFDRLGDLYLLNPIGKFFWDKSDATRAAAVTTTGQAWALWERAIEDGGNFLCGAEITLPDLSAAVAADLAVSEGLPLTDTIRRYHERLLEHPVLAASAAAAAPFVEATRARRIKA
jgi:glutathione S-transferase